MRKHVSRVHEKKKDYTCEKCHDSFHSKQELDFHVESNHKSINSINCQHCNKEIKETRLNYHIRQVHENLKNHTCDLCKKDFMNKHSLSKHVQYVHGSESQLKKCDICGKEIKEFKLKSHMKLMHQNSKHFPCEFCKKVLTNKGNLAQHVIDVHKLNKMMKCEKCNLEIKENKFKRHMKEKHEKESPICPICKKNYSTNSILNKHIQNVHEKTIQKCDKCGKSFKPDTLRKHIRIVHDKAYTQTCGLCNKLLTTKSELRKHLDRVHKSETKSENF